MKHLAPILLVVLACASQAPVSVVNGLTVPITEIRTGAQGPNLLQQPLRPGDSHTFTAKTGELRITATDQGGTVYRRETTLDSNGLIWEVIQEHETAVNPWAGNSPVTLTNGLTRPLSRILCSPSNHSEWGDDWNTQPLPAGETFTFHVAPGTYDIQVQEGNSRYTRWRVDITQQGWAWSISPQDRDASG